MNGSVELSAMRLLMQASFFTKMILLVLLSISVSSWAIIFHKYVYVKLYRTQILKFLKTLTTPSRLSVIEESCAHFSRGRARTMPTLLLKLIRLKQQGRKLQSPETVINNAVMHEMNTLQKGMGVLATTANVSPLIGLLGTVWGIMYSFINISQQKAASIDVVAPGIAEALITTIAGLVVAIPAMVGHNFLTGWINHCLDGLDRTSEFALSLFSNESDV